MMPRSQNGYGMRPKIPLGMRASHSRHPAKWIRQCLNQDPEYRPSAKQLKDWLEDDCRTTCSLCFSCVRAARCLCAVHLVLN